ncbi:MAG: DUF3159 domain-containing protein [Dermatophilaceae bacterium]
MSAEPAPSMGTVEELLRHRLTEVLGGRRGAVETGVPTVAFVVVWMLSGNVRAALLTSGVAVVALVAWRLWQRQTVRYALSSVAATAIAAVFALRSGRPEDAFLPSILWNLAMGLIYLVSALVRWPLMGFLIAAADPDAATDPAVFTRWRAQPGVVRVCQRLTLVLAALMLGRAAIMLPLHAAGAVALLGVAKIVLGWPAYAAVLGAMMVLLVRGRTPLTDGESPGPL